MKILLIEDHPHMLLAIRLFLEKDGFTVEGHSCGNAGYARALQKLHDVIIMDTMLYGKNGLEILSGLKKAEIKTPVILFSALAHRRDRKKAHRLSPHYFYQKDLLHPDWRQSLQNLKTFV